MPAQQGARASSRDVRRQRVEHGLRLALVGHMYADNFAPHYGGTRLRQRVGGHVVERFEPPLAQLLPTALLIERHHLHHLWVIEVSHGRVIESDMTILTDADAGEVDVAFE